MFLKLFLYVLFSPKTPGVDAEYLTYSIHIISFFRNCDPLFDLQNKSNDNEIDWLSASNAIEGSESAARTDFASTGPHANALKNQPEDLEPSKLKTECSSAIDTNMISVPSSDKTSPQLSEVEDTSLLSCISVANTSNETAEIKDNIVLRDQVSNTCFTGFFNDRLRTL